MGPGQEPSVEQRLNRAQASARKRRYTAHFLAVLVVVMGGLDCISTELALSTGRAIEANPLVRWLQEALGPWWVAPKMAIHAVLAFAVIAIPTRLALWSTAGVTALTTAAALNNLVIAHAHLV
ncbi:MAG: DUF5658 family protein [Pseudomonadota bacterium]